jgi:hypothetical protein
MGEQQFDRSYWSTSTLAEQSPHSRGKSGDSGNSERTSTSSSQEKAANVAGRSSKKARLDFNNILEIHVGDEGCFLVPVNRITQRSEFFRDKYDSLQRTTVGDEIPVVGLPKEDRFLFDIYLQVVYQDEVILPLHVDEASDPHWSIRAMVRTYMLADGFKDVTSCNIIVDGLIEFCSRHDLVFESGDWNVIFRGDHKVPVLRKLAVDFCVLATQPEFSKTQMRQMPEDMAIDCVARFADLRHGMLMQVARNERPYSITSLADLDLCERYHQHDESCPPCPTLTRESKRKTSIRRRDSSASSEQASELNSYYSAQQDQ